MSVINNKLLNDILSLPVDVRSKLIEKLIESLNVPIQKEIDLIWKEEAENRITAIHSEKITLVDGEETIVNIRERLIK